MPDPTARPVGWWDTIWGNPTRFAQQPHSQGALLGAGYQGMPTAARIVDLRHNAPDYPYQLTHPDPNDPPWADPKIYPPSVENSKAGGFFPDQNTGHSLFGWIYPEDTAPYHPSFQQNMRPRSATIPFGPPQPAQFGNLPFPVTPGDPGWTTPPSVSGPHNRQGDPNRPGYDHPIFWPQNAAGITLNSLPPDPQAGF